MTLGRRDLDAADDNLLVLADNRLVLDDKVLLGNCSRRGEGTRWRGRAQQDDSGEQSRLGKNKSQHATASSSGQ